MTAPAITITDGTTTINLNSLSSGVGIMTTKYHMMAPTINAETIEVGRDRQNLATPGYGNVTETLELVIIQSTVAGIQTSIQSIEIMLDGLRQSMRVWGPTKYYIQVQHSADGTSWRSELMAGQLEVGDVLDQLTYLSVECRLIITRRYYWEGARLALELSTAENTTPTTSEVALYVTDDQTAGERNYINIASTQVGGALPTPIELQLRNAEATDVDWSVFHLSNYAKYSTAIDPIYMGSAADSPGASRTWSVDYETMTHRWSVSATQCSYWKGAYVRLIAIITNTPDAYLRAGVVLGDATLSNPIYLAGSQVYVDSAGVWDLGVVPLPPYAYSGETDAMGIAIFGQVEGGATLTIDHIQLFMAGQHRYRRLEQMAYDLSNTYAVVEDGPEGLAYIRDTSDDGRLPIIRTFHDPLMIWPGITNLIRVYIRGATKGDQLEAKAWYRQRRLSI